MARPSVVFLMSTSVDGRTALGPGRSQWEELADPRTSMSEGAGEVWKLVEKELMELHNPQAIMLGSASIQKEGDPLKPLEPKVGEAVHLREDHLPEDVVRDLGVRVWLVVPDSRGRLRSGYKGTETPGHHVLHLVTRTTPFVYLAFLRRQKIPYMVAGTVWVDLKLALSRLASELGVRCVLVIGGGRLNGALLRAGLVDEVNVIIRPELIGGTATPTMFDCPDLAADAWPVPLDLVGLERPREQFLWLRYRAAREEHLTKRAPFAGSA